MRICVVSEKKTKVRQGFEIALKGDFRGIAIYDVGLVLTSRKKRLKKRIKRLCEKLAELGVTMCAATSRFDGSEFFGTFGMLLVDVNEFFLGKTGKMALEFTQRHGIDADFLLIGGGFSDICNAANEILTKRRQIYIRSARFEDVAEAITSETGACVRCDYPDDVIYVDMCKKENFITYGEISASASDFKVCFPENLIWEADETSIPAIAAMLEICGFLKEKDVKIRYFLK